MAVGSARTPLAVHVVLDGRADESTRVFARRLHAHLSGGDRPARIPVRFWAGPRLPSLPLAAAERNAIILLVDQPFFAARSAWQPALDELLPRVQDPANALILPVSICGDAQRVTRSLHDTNCVLVDRSTTLVEDQRALQALLTGLLRLLPDSEEAPTAVPPPVFLCHTRNHGREVARELRRYVYEDTQLSCFFDVHDIPHGRPVTESIAAAVRTSAMLVVWTDDLLNSRWCQYEILEARKHQRPILVLDALREGAPRVFPFLGNLPVVRWHQAPGPVLTALLTELVRARHLGALFRTLTHAAEADGAEFGLHPPDLLDSALALNGRHVTAPSVHVAGLRVYPDPPLQPSELEFLRASFPGHELASLSQWTAHGAARRARARASDGLRLPLEGLTVGLSVSFAEGWSARGMVPEHQEELAVDLARELILLGARVAWGGDLRPDGIGGRLRALVLAYHRAERPPQDHLASYLAWSLTSGSLDERALAERREFADVHTTGLPALHGEADAGAALDTPDGRAMAALGFSHMRRVMADACDARIVLGGRTRGFAGLYPGVAEEALATVHAGRALYVVPGFGGAAAGVYTSIADPGAAGDPLRDGYLGHVWTAAGASELDVETARQHHSLVDRLAESAAAEHYRLDLAAMWSRFAALGKRGLAETAALHEAEVERLAVSTDVYEVLRIVIGGLARVRASARGEA